MTDKERIEAAVQQHGFTVQEWTKTDDGLTAMLGRFLVVSPDEEDDGIYEGDKGALSAVVVGAAKYGNQRVSFGLTTDGTDSPNEVHDLSVLAPTEAADRASSAS